MLHYQGVPGSYSHAASLHFAESLKLPASSTQGHDVFDQVWESVGPRSYAVLPIENSYAGPIHTNIYNFLRYDHQIIADYYQSIDHCLIAGHTDRDQITDVWSHPQALAQCYEYCKAHGITQHEAGDTAGSVKYLAAHPNPTHAAIGSALSAELYGMHIVDQSIQDNSSNTTRFLLVGRKGAHVLPSPTKTIMLFAIRNGQGVLYKCLGAFATHGIDLTKIESLPSKKDPFTYYFQVECVARSTDEMMKSALHELAFFAKEIRILGEV